MLAVDACDFDCCFSQNIYDDAPFAAANMSYFKVYKVFFLIVYSFCCEFRMTADD